jgi:Zn-dependent M28 family amino/carboxypeptidase
MPASEAARLIALSGGNFASILDEQPGPAFRAVPLNLQATFDTWTHVRRFTSNNVVGRIRGSARLRADRVNESVLLLGHWDHLGICGAEGDADRICNGAVDNASGIATLIEVAGRLASGPRPPRDILILATTAEEVGLLGAEHFAAYPPVPLETIVAAVNFDTVAIHGTGQPVAVIGRGLATLDEAIAAAAAAMGRTMDTTYAADAFIQRQDGWALSQAGVPAVMVGGSFADMEALQRFLGGDYHGASDDVRPDIPLDGAAEDANLSVALARRLADPALYRKAQP